MEKIDHLRQWLGTGSINIFGIQFSGKDTLGYKLTEIFNAKFISSGDVMRDVFAAKTNTDDKIWQASRIGSLTGQLMPTEEFKEMIVRRLSQPDLNGKPLILSTVGRWIGEEQPVINALKASDHDTKAVILINISEDEAWRRWHLVHDTRNGGRDDDIDEQKVARRISEFKTKTSPVIEVYKNMGILLNIDGEQPKEKVLQDVIDALYELSLA